MPSLKSRKSVILFDLEETYGTDVTPDAATAVKAFNLDLKPLEGDQEEQDFINQGMGNQPSVPVGIHHTLSFTVQLAAGGAAGTAPGYGKLLRACGMAETVTEDTDVAYQPTSDDGDSATIYFYLDGNRHRLLGARGSCRIRGNALQMPKLEFTFTGLYTAPTAVSLPTPDFTAYQAGIPVSNANTPTFTLHGFSPVVSDLSIDLGNSIVHEDLINSESVERTDRRATGSITMNTPAIGDHDFYAAAKAATLGALQLVHGTSAGSIVQIDAPKVQVLAPRHGDRNGKSTLTLDLRFTPDSGDDDLTITIK